MKGILDLKRKKFLRLGILLLSTLFIISASALVYARIFIEKPLTVGNTSGVTAGSGSTASPGVNFTPAVMVMLAVVGIVVGLSMFTFLREAFKHVSNAPDLGLSPTGPVSTSPVSTSPATPGVGLPSPSHLPPMERDEWEESPAKQRGE